MLQSVQLQTSEQYYLIVLSCNDIQVYYESAKVCPQLSSLPAPNIVKLEEGCNDLIRQWSEANRLPTAVCTGLWLLAEPVFVASRVDMSLWTGSIVVAYVNMSACLKLPSVTCSWNEQSVPLHFVQEFASHPAARLSKRYG